MMDVLPSSLRPTRWAATAERVLDCVAACERAEMAASAVAEAEAKLAELARPLALTGEVDDAALNQEDVAIEEAGRALRAWEQGQAAA